jgi:uncharacterized protein YcbX
VSPEVGRVEEVWRYPVKGLRGETRARLALDGRGVVGDRRFAVAGADGKLGSAKTTRRFRRMPNLLSMAATGDDGNGDGTGVTVRFPDGAHGEVADPATAARLSAVVGEPVTLAAEAATSHLDAAAVHLVTTASLRWLQARLPHAAVDRRRFRPNLVIGAAGDGLVEEGWIGAELIVGTVRLRVVGRTVRCVTPALAQDGLAAAPAIVGELERANDLCLGVYASVLTPGVVVVGAPVRLDRPTAGRPESAQDGWSSQPVCVWPSGRKNASMSCTCPATTLKISGITPTTVVVPPWVEVKAAKPATTPRSVSAM